MKHHSTHSHHGAFPPSPTPRLEFDASLWEATKPTVFTTENDGSTRQSTVSLQSCDEPSLVSWDGDSVTSIDNIFQRCQYRVRFAGDGSLQIDSQEPRGPVEDEKEETISPTNANNNSSARFPHPLCTVHEIPSRRHFTATQKHRLWWTPEEIQEMKVECAVLAHHARNNPQILKHLMFLYEESSSTLVVERSIRKLRAEGLSSPSAAGRRPQQGQYHGKQHGWTYHGSLFNQDCCILGLEKFIMPSHMRDQDIEKHQDAVLDMADTIWDNCDEDLHFKSDRSTSTCSVEHDLRYQEEEKRLRQASLETSTNMRVFAQRLALLAEAM